jgi:signal transduction histidine kinase/ligand-binding sensor domain-containing protein
MRLDENTGTTFRPLARLSISFLVLLVSCLLFSIRHIPGAFSFAQDQTSQPPVVPSPSPAPSPSPTPVNNLHQWGSVTLFHGLPSDRVRAITQGPDGAMWFGTDAGLAKLDGRRTQAISDPEIPPGRVLALLTDAAGALWIGTETGAARMTYGSVVAIKDLQGKSVTAMLLTNSGGVVLATEQGMIYECHARSEGPLEVKQLLREPLQSADRENRGLLPLTSLTIAHDKLLAGSLSRGLLTIENGSAQEVQARRPAFFVRALATDSRGQVWVGTKSRKDEPALHSTEEMLQFSGFDAPTGTVMSLYPGREDDMWVGTDGRGVFHFSATRKIERLTFDGTLGGLRSDHVYSLFIDREGVIWFGTDRGVCRYDPQAPQLETVGDNPESNFVRTLFETSGGRVLAGTNRGLYVYDDSAHSWKPITELSRNVIYALSEDKTGRLLVGSASGFYISQSLLGEEEIKDLTFSRLEATSGSIDSSGTRAITHCRGSTYIASFGRGVEEFQASHLRNAWPKDSKTTRDVISLYCDNDRRLLIGTANNGILVLQDNEVVSDPTLTRLDGSTVRAITRTPSGALWAATNRGVFVCKTGSDCTVISPLEGRSISTKLDRNELWFATTGGGLLKVAVDEQVGPIVAQLDAEQGLPSQNAFAVLSRPQKDGSEQLLIATNRGLVRYVPGRIVPTLYATRIISKRIHQPNELRAGLNLEYPQNSLLLDLAAISSRTFPEQFQYAFILSDSKNKVIRQKLSRESQFAMEALSPGKYRVNARAFTKDLIASEPLSFEFSVARAPFPWTSTALAILLALTLLALFWALLERRRIVATSAALVGANQDLANARLSLANEAERERRRIARDLHDQTLADLRHLMLVTDQLSSNGEQHQKKFDAAELRNEIESISQEVRRICEDLSPSVLQNVGFAAALEFAVSHAAQGAPADKRFAYEFVCDESLEEQAKLPQTVQIQIYRIVQEAVNNIWSHAGATWVKLTLTNDQAKGFLLTIEDNGREFEPELSSRTDGRGLANMRARASLIEAELSWTPRAGGGSLFTLVRSDPGKQVEIDVKPRGSKPQS